MAEIEELDEQFGNQVPIGLGCALDSFREVNEIQEILGLLPNIYETPLTVSRK